MILQVKQVQSDLQHLKIEGVSRMDERGGDSSPGSGMQMAMLADIQSLKTQVSALGKPLTLEMNNLRKESENINREINRLMKQIREVEAKNAFRHSVIVDQQYSPRFKHNSSSNEAIQAVSASTLSKMTSSEQSKPTFEPAPLQNFVAAIPVGKSADFGALSPTNKALNPLTRSIRDPRNLVKPSHPVLEPMSQSKLSSKLSNHNAHVPSSSTLSQIQEKTYRA